MKMFLGFSLKEIKLRTFINLNLFCIRVRIFEMNTCSFFLNKSGGIVGDELVFSDHRLGSDSLALTLTSKNHRGLDSSCNCHIGSAALVSVTHLQKVFFLNVNRYIVFYWNAVDFGFHIGAT